MAARGADVGVPLPFTTSLNLHKPDMYHRHSR